MIDQQEVILFGKSQVFDVKIKINHLMRFFNKILEYFF